MRTSSITFPVAIAGALMIAVACGPKQDRAPIAAEKPTPFGLAMSACKDNLRSSLAKAVGTEKEKATAKVCLSTLTDVPVSYKISKGDSRHQISAAASEKPVAPSEGGDATDSETTSASSDAPALAEATISMRIGLDISATLSRDEQIRFIKRLSEECVSATDQIFARSPLHSFGTVVFSPTFSFVKVDDLGGVRGKFDQTIALSQVVENGDISYALNNSVLRFYEDGKAKDVAACRAAIAKRPYPANTDSICQAARDARSKVNRPFCAAFAQLSSTWLGLTDVKKETLKCGLPFTDDKAPPASSFVAPSTKSADEFFATARLSEKDLIQILTPACPSMAQIPN